jgi:hypothetical protein
VSPDHGFRPEDDEDVDPAGPEPTKRSPEEMVDGVQGRPRLFALQHRDLPSEREDFEGCVAPTAEENADHSDQLRGWIWRELTLIA